MLYRLSVLVSLFCFALMLQAMADKPIPRHKPDGNLGDMRPLLASHDSFNQRRINTKLSPEAHVIRIGGSKQAADLNDLFGGEFRSANALPTRAATLRVSISNVIGLRSWKQMRRTEAASVVAVVEDEPIRRYRPVSQDVGEPMRPNITYNSVPVPIDSSWPLKAGIALWNFAEHGNEKFAIGGIISWHPSIIYQMALLQQRKKKTVPRFPGDGNSQHDNQPSWCQNTDAKGYAPNCSCRAMEAEHCNSDTEPDEPTGPDSSKCMVWCRKTACRCGPVCG